MGERRLGQVFVIGAVLFSGLIVLAFLPLGPSITSSSTPNFLKFYQQSFREQTNVFNSAVSENRSLDNVRKELYSYDRFVDERTSAKGINFDTFQLAVLPQRGELIFINYQNRALDTRLYVDGSWTNTTVKPDQYLNQSFSSGTTRVRLILPSMNDEYTFDTASPRLVYWMKMEFGNEAWEQSYIG